MSPPYLTDFSNGKSPAGSWPTQLPGSACGGGRGHRADIQRGHKPAAFRAVSPLAGCGGGHWARPSSGPTRQITEVSIPERRGLKLCAQKCGHRRQGVMRSRVRKAGGGWQKKQWAQGGGWGIKGGWYSQGVPKCQALCWHCAFSLHLPINWASVVIAFDGWESET